MTTSDLNAKLLSSAADKTNFQTTSDFSDELKARLSAAISEKEKKSRHPRIYIQTDETLAVSIDGKKITLKPRSQEILAYLLTAIGRVVPNTELVRKILKRQPDNESMLAMRVLWFNLKEELKAYGIDYIACSTRNGRGRYLERQYVFSDLDDLISGSSRLQCAFYINNFLYCYDWAAEMRHKLVRLAELQLRKAA